MENRFIVKVNDSLQFSFKESEIKNLDIIRLSPKQFHVLQNNQSFNFKLESSNFNKRLYALSVNANKYTVKIQNNLDHLIQDIGLSATTTAKSSNIKAPMPGLILNINIKKGQEVNEGDTLLILEAMKMENTITSPKTGVIKSVKIKVGETVEKGQFMIALE